MITLKQPLLDLRRKIQPPERRRLDAWREYEGRKQQWSITHPDAPPQEYEAAMRKIAEQVGV